MAHPNDTVKDPFKYLEDDHEEVAALIKKLEGASDNPAERQELFTQLKEGLSLHAELEETIVYPALEELKKTHMIALEAVEEHAIIKRLIAEMDEMAVDSDQWDAKLAVLKENIETHVKEEEKDMFKKARSELEDEEVEAMRQGMEEFLAA
jgi:hypothetical protein